MSASAVASSLLEDLINRFVPQVHGDTLHRNGKRELAGGVAVYITSSKNIPSFLRVHSPSNEGESNVISSTIDATLVSYHLQLHIRVSQLPFVMATKVQRILELFLASLFNFSFFGPSTLASDNGQTSRSKMGAFLRQGSN